ncbi:uncharacterized protein [Leptinotarsa decemlineata]|uniref:uncharacterized protein n=1 Tax=Leptinotarsa decemlineata TaxID=7539 RepID=UPI003D307E5D
MSTYCSVDGCLSTVGSPGISFFRCPKYSERCQRWKNVLGFIGNHRYANLTPEQSHNRIKICSLHFRADDIVNSRIHSYAVPSLRLPQDGSQKDDDDIAGTSKDFIYIDAQVQTDQLGSRDECSQTSAKLSSGTPRKVALRKKNYITRENSSFNIEKSTGRNRNYSG